MESATYSMTAQAMGESKGDESLFVRFYVAPVENKAASKEEGRPIFEDKEYIEIRIPGDRKSAVTRIARQKDIDRFPRHYAAFKNRTSEEVEEIGTPLREWTPIPRSLVEEFAYFNIKTVEQLAGVNDGNVQKASGLFEWRQKARDFLERAEAEADGIKFDALKTENEELKDQVAELLARLEKLEEVEED